MGKPKLRNNPAPSIKKLLASSAPPTRKKLQAKQSRATNSQTFIHQDRDIDIDSEYTATPNYNSLPVVESVESQQLQENVCLPTPIMLRVKNLS